jgi:putative DNA primase/helicase
MLADDIHAQLGDAWPTVLLRLGVPATTLRNIHGPCPACGGQDRFRFDNYRGRGDFFCNECGPGDGFNLLQKIYGWPFKECRLRVLAEMRGLSSCAEQQRWTSVSSRIVPDHAELRARLSRTLKECVPLKRSEEAIQYLASRGLRPGPYGALHAHPGLDYWITDPDSDRPRILGTFTALISEVVDVTGRLITLHATYVEGSRKLSRAEPRKFFSRLRGHEGCAVRLHDLTGETLGVAEGLETAISASMLHNVPVWATLSASLLCKFTPPLGVRTLLVFADNDPTGLSAAHRLKQNCSGRCQVSVCLPPNGYKDWNDVLCATPVSGRK